MTPSPGAEALPAFPTATSGTVVRGRVISEIGAFVRGGPGTEYEVIGEVSPQTLFDVLSFAISSVGDTWYLIRLENGLISWISNQVAALEAGSSIVDLAYVATIPPTTTAIASPLPSPTTALPQGANARVRGRQGMNLRSGAGFDYTLIGAIPHDMPLAIIGRDPAANWYQVVTFQQPAQVGWGAASQIDVFLEPTSVAITWQPTPNTALFAAGALPPTLVAPVADSPPVLWMTCHAEPRWNYTAVLYPLPDPESEALGEFLHDEENYEMRVIGRNSAWDWYHVIYQEMVGWVERKNVNLFGVCDALPVTDAQPQIAISAVPPVPPLVAMPAFAAPYVQLTPFDRGFLVKPEMLYIRREMPGEPSQRIQAHILILNLNAPQVRVGVTVGGIPDVRRATVSEMAFKAGAFAAITGDYFAGNNFPQGMTVIDGQIVTAPKSRATFALGADKNPYIGYFTDQWSWSASVTAANGAAFDLLLMNLPCEEGWLCIYSHHMAGRIPAEYPGLRVLLDPSFKVLNLIDGGRVEIPAGHFVLNGTSGAADWLRGNINIGDVLTVRKPTTPPWQDFQYAISGGPRLIVNGHFWQECNPAEAEYFCEEFDAVYRARHYGNSVLPRASVGFNAAANILIAIMVEGYEVEDSRGVTQRELANMFLEFGADQAMEFDGGGSATLYMQPHGSVNDFTREGERAVTNALLFFWDE